ncbi:hypothetical protein NKJ87_04550 [Mesorhizobium sp. M0027]|uniref:hypothetical protein n=1 Tax=unclassified Mesorhizobium TaxID=325217 RepID=UPI00333550CB
MAKIKDPKDINAIVREPEVAGTEIERKDITGKDSSEAPVNPKTSGAPEESKDPLPDPFAGRKSDAPREAGKTPRPTDKPGE